LTIYLPIVPPLLKGKAKIDLFKPLSRALSKHYKRIRHAPYILSVSITETYLTFLRPGEHIGAIAVIVYDHPNAISVKGNKYNY
ncbi:uncharacterized protein K441DRAFT_537830, partial [Cenococcum geophilum 1.58]|uniref:uncharacterized protein n=1 Tax=Cenococcum geophilum 1.58 TaxID=794803 RepID=UPI00358EF8E3